MTDKVQKIKEYLVGMAGAACCDAKTKKVIKENILPFIDSLQEETVVQCVPFEPVGVPVDKVVPANIPDKKEEPVSDDLENAARAYSNNIDNIYGSIGEQTRNAFKAGAQWQKSNLWKPSDGDDLPEIDREVIALLDNSKVVFAHRPNPEGWDGKSLSTGKVEHYIPKTYDKGGWNIPNVVYWLDAKKLPYEEK